MGSQNEMMTQTTDLINGSDPLTAKELKVRGRQRWQGAPWVPREPSRCSPSSGGNSSDGKSECHLWHSNQMTVSRESSKLGQTRRSFRV